MQEEKIIIGEEAKVPEYKAEVPKEQGVKVSMASELNTLDEPISTTIVINHAQRE